MAADPPHGWRHVGGGALLGAAVAVVVLGLLVAGTGLVEGTVPTTGETEQSWCEGSPGYDSNQGPLERCVREQTITHLVAADRHEIQFYRAASGATRHEPHPWPLDGSGIEVEFDDDGVTVTNDAGMSATYPNSVFDDAR